MAQLYFHCTSRSSVLLDQNGTAADDLVEARDRAHAVARRLITTKAFKEDWREWMVHVSDAGGEEVLLVPFAEVIGRPH